MAIRDVRFHGHLQNSRRVIFTGAGGAEQPVWDAAIQRFLVTLPGTTIQAPEVAIIDPKNIGLRDCESLIPSRVQRCLVALVRALTVRHSVRSSTYSYPCAASRSL